MNKDLDTLMKLERENNKIMRRIKENIIEEWQTAEAIKEGGVTRESFVSAMKQEIPRLNKKLLVDEKTFLRVYYDNTPFWCRGRKQT